MYAHMEVGEREGERQSEEKASKRATHPPPSKKKKKRKALKRQGYKRACIERNPYALLCLCAQAFIEQQDLEESTMQLHVRFREQRCSSRRYACSCDPTFNEQFYLGLPSSIEVRGARCC